MMSFSQSPRQQIECLSKESLCVQTAQVSEWHTRPYNLKVCRELLYAVWSSARDCFSDHSLINHCSQFLYLSLGVQVERLLSPLSLLI
jgi:hypothetical protein